MMTYPAYVPEFCVGINGEDLPSVLRRSVTGVRYEEGMGAADRVEVDFANPDVALLQDHVRGLGFRPYPTGVKVGPVRSSVRSARAFDLDNKLTLDLGYAPELPERVFEGEITGLEADFPNEGMPTVRLVAHDYLHRLSEGKYARGFGVVPDFVVASILTAENLLVPMIDPLVAHASNAVAVVNALFKGTGRKQAGESDLDLLKKIASTYDADFWVEGHVLFLSRFFKEYAPRLTLIWGASLRSFNPRLSKVGQVAGVAAKFTLSELPLDFVVTVTWDFDREALAITVVPGEANTISVSAKSVTGPVLTLIRRPIGSPADILKSALLLVHKLRSTVNNRLTGEASAVGDPRIRAGAVITIEGVGPDFSGNYRVVAATHVIGSGGYRTDFKVRKEIIP